ncbi:MAG TPA: hypothetical protein DHV17_08465 [Chitinophagaceae bacterium]|nr:hypothetical protein [Chitinophagaceae bacterium]
MAYSTQVFRFHFCWACADCTKKRQHSPAVNKMRMLQNYRFRRFPHGNFYKRLMPNRRSSETIPDALWHQSKSLILVSTLPYRKQSTKKYYFWKNYNA